MTTEALPLLDLFTDLQQAGLPLGIDEYKALLQALQAGFGCADYNDLKGLCQLLWLKSPAETHQFERIFKQWQTLQTRSTVALRRPSPSSKPNISSSSSRGSEEKEEGSETPFNSASSPSPPSASRSFALQAIKTELSVHRQVIPQRYVLQTDYFPLTPRQMKQSWRYLRRPVRQGRPTELDLPATINQLAQRGLLLQPVLRPPRRNRMELLFLFDRNGSMVPFHHLGERLLATAQRGGRLGQIMAWYFHNAPGEYLYQNQYCLEAIEIEALFSALEMQRLGVVIFSDAGAARGGYNDQRIALTHQFLKQLKGYTNRFVWLNPTPQKRWINTTAQQIASEVLMFETSRRAFQQAIDYLRGHSSPGLP